MVIDDFNKKEIVRKLKMSSWLADKKKVNDLKKLGADPQDLHKSTLKWLTF